MLFIFFLNNKFSKTKINFPFPSQGKKPAFQLFLSPAKTLAISNIALLLCLIPIAAKAQQTITPADGTGTVVDPQGNNINISGGSLSSNQANLFHSFSKFGLDANQTANFLSQPSIQNILGRVTGGEASLINGLIRVSGGNSNLYLINPAGIIFGQNASLNVPGSFTATTANRLGFGNDNWLNAVGSNDYSQLIGAPNSFAFDGSVASAIFNQGNLAVPSGSNLSLFAGTVVSTGNLSAPGGNVTIATVPGSSILRLSMPGNPLSLEIQPPNSTSNNLVSNSLPALLTGGGAGNVSGVMVNNGEVQLVGSGLAVNNGDVVSIGNIVAYGAATINATGNITTGNITTADRINGTAGGVTLTAGGNITTNNINTSAFSRFGTATAGAVNLTAGGSIKTNNIDTSAALTLGIATSGGVTLTSGSNITVGSINTTAMSFDARNIRLVAISNLPDQNIPLFAQGGDVNISANGTVRIVGEIFDRGQPTGNSIFTSAFNQPGAVKIQHDGGINNVPFIVGDASLNGTAAAINVSQFRPVGFDPISRILFLDSTNSQISPTSAVNTFPVKPLGGTADGTPSRISIISLNTPPTLSGNSNLLNIQPNQSFTFRFDSLNINLNDLNNDNHNIVFDGILSGSLNFQNGTLVTPGTILNANTILVYTPPQGSFGQIPAFTVRVSDGVSESVSQQININVTPSSVPPIITNNPPDIEPINLPTLEINNFFNPETNNLLTVDLNNFVNLEEDKIATKVTRSEKNKFLLETEVDGAIDKAISKIDTRFTNQFVEYLGIDRPVMKTIQEVRDTLVDIETATGGKPALIYISFIPKTVKGNVLLEQNLTPQDDDILELLMLTGKGVPIRKVVNVTRSQLLAVNKTFTNYVTNPGSGRNHITPSKLLYNWLIAPLNSHLQERQINNLVFITDVGLRSMPIAAIYDGQQYLIENYTVSLMPSFSLTDTKYVDIKKAEVLGMGASQFMNLDPLPSVPSELTTITQKLWFGRAFLNEDFTLKNLTAQRQQKAFGIVHLATHGEFKSGVAGNSYIQLWDSQLQMNQMRQLGWNNPPVELVVLSACRTALGDKEAEFGFAGFAVQSGAKSALASLWSVSDEGTFGLMTQFYEKLKQAPVKVEALRRAQVAMLKGEVRLESGKLRTARGDVPLPEVLVELGDKKLTHPFFWSAFTMIGNPW
ncbi:CHAT domain-containing protein [Fortiea sp. LEGE XX443]|uniref:CHAT domain-containing protein n=1 Tax=Fortiea sp. LEGE XX443 TaxID=1828611 RepID=UPI0018815166|nr:CHAT domain-containing protein [Fortiea sp. LEGE XX443]MBE9005794.1 CHAT domain-containing protein [Fortiea sp. LEGE XX443]